MRGKILKNQIKTLTGLKMPCVATDREEKNKTIAGSLGKKKKHSVTRVRELPRRSPSAYLIKC